MKKDIDLIYVTGKKTYNGVIKRDLLIDEMSHVASWFQDCNFNALKLLDLLPIITTVTINDTVVKKISRTEYTSQKFPAAKGSVSGSLKVYHSDNGSKSITVSLTTAIYTATTSTKSGTWALDKIDRYASITSARFCRRFISSLICSILSRIARSSIAVLKLIAKSAATITVRTVVRISSHTKGIERTNFSMGL